MPDTRSGPAPALVLFDIDGTLIRRSGPHHRQALVNAVYKVTGLTTTTDGIPVHGMLDPDILTLMLKAAGAPGSFIRRQMPAIIGVAQSVYARCCPNLASKVCPGVRGLLGRLARRGVPMGLVTGNLTRIGWKKLERADLKRHFRFGAFGEMSRDRTGLARIAIREARGRGWIGRGTKVSLIGDAPPDVRAALANGIYSVAVATGISSVEDLAAESPHLLIEDLRSLSLRDLLP